MGEFEDLRRFAWEKANQSEAVKQLKACLLKQLTWHYKECAFCNGPSYDLCPSGRKIYEQWTSVMGLSYVNRKVE